MKHFVAAGLTVLALSGAARAALINVDTPGDPIIPIAHTVAGGANGDAEGPHVV